MQPFNPQRAPVFAKTGMACSSQPLAAAVGRDILKAGGNAADAAIAMAAMVNVTEPMMNGLGGDCMILAHWNGESFGLNGSGRSGSRLTIDNLRAAGFSAMPHAGATAVPVPGALDAYLALHERFGTMDFCDLVEPAAAYAEEGFAVGAKIAQAWEWGASSSSVSPPTPRPTCLGAARRRPETFSVRRTSRGPGDPLARTAAPRFTPGRSVTVFSTSCTRPAVSWTAKISIGRRPSGSSPSAAPTAGALLSSCRPTDRASSP